AHGRFAGQEVHDREANVDAGHGQMDAPDILGGDGDAEYGRHRRNLHEGRDAAAEGDVGIDVVDSLLFEERQDMGKWMPPTFWVAMGMRNTDAIAAIFMKAVMPPQKAMSG